MDDLVNQLSRTLAQANRFIAIKLKKLAAAGYVRTEKAWRIVAPPSCR